MTNWAHGVLIRKKIYPTVRICEKKWSFFILRKLRFNINTIKIKLGTSKKILYDHIIDRLCSRVIRWVHNHFSFKLRRKRYRDWSAKFESGNSLTHNNRNKVLLTLASTIVSISYIIRDLKFLWLLSICNSSYSRNVSVSSDSAYICNRLEFRSFFRKLLAYMYVNPYFKL